MDFIMEVQDDQTQGSRGTLVHTCMHIYALALDKQISGTIVLRKAFLI